MQTFLPVADFEESARVLDPRRLGKQRVECLQLVAALITGEPQHLANHTAARMWKGFELSLCLYGAAVCQEWINRGFKDAVREKIHYLYHGLRRAAGLGEGLVAHPLPPWWNDPRLHSNHRARLLAKEPGWYYQFGWKEAPCDVNYWPVPTMKELRTRTT